MRSAARAVATGQERGCEGSAAATRRSGSAKTAIENTSEFGFNGGEAGIKHFAARHNDYVVAWRKLVMAEHLSNESLRSVSRYRATNLPCGGDPEPSDLQFVV